LRGLRGETERRVVLRVVVGVGVVERRVAVENKGKSLEG
jgi:hypothetical protein